MAEDRDTRLTAAGLRRRLCAAVIDAAALGTLTTSWIDQPLGYLGPLGGAAATAIGWSVAAAYLPVQWGAWGSTLGQRVAGLRVVRESGEPLDFRVAILRLVGLMLALLPLGLGMLRVASDRDKQGWHDRIAGSHVLVAGDEGGRGEAVDPTELEAVRRRVEAASRRVSVARPPLTGPEPATESQGHANE